MIEQQKSPYSASTKPRMLVVTRGDPGPWGAGLRFAGLNQALEIYFDLLVYCYEPPTGERSSLSWLDARLPSSIHQRVGTVEQDHFAYTVREQIEVFRPHLLLVSGTQTFPFLNTRFEIPTILDAYDLNWIRLQRRLDQQASQNWLQRGRNRLKVALAQRYEAQRYQKADEIWVCSRVDGERVKQTGYRGRVAVIPNFSPTVDLPFPQVERARKNVLFLGTMGYYANRDGVSWFLSHCWPLIKQQQPDAQFMIVGKWPDWAEPGLEYQQSGVQCLGFVTDLTSIWQKADVFVCPLHIGSGTRIKILEAWAYKIPVVSTSIGIEGLEAVHEQEALIADDSYGLARGVLELLNNNTQHKQIAQAAHELWQTSYTAERVGELAVQRCRLLCEHEENNPSWVK